MAVIPDGYAQANFRFTGESAPNGAEVTLGLNLAFSSATPTEVAGICGGKWEDSVLPFQCDDISLDEVLVKFGPTATGPSGVSQFGTPGGDVGASEAPAVSVLVRKLTDLGGRAGRGRMYIPGIRDTRVDSSGHVDGTYATDLGIGLVTFKDALEAEDLGLVVLHGPESPLTVPTPIQFLIVQQYVGTQRRRQIH